ncbi:MAG: hypothetical protein F4117_07915 [Acidimicrobiales bacterium]|nr:hypothetical protein [Acidimicrobiales bacterium]MYB81382.1 hypothetical protein [Acidimicrobiales bacterium]MYI12475.1 hypothetical protein [Acidimicrobiales bacterium]
MVAETIEAVDERYPGYRVDLAKAIIEVVNSQETAATEAARRDRIQDLVESLGASITSKASDSE